MKRIFNYYLSILNAVVIFILAQLLKGYFYSKTVDDQLGTFLCQFKFNAQLGFEPHYQTVTLTPSLI